MAEVSVFHETRESLLQKARIAMQLAEAETLPNRARIHVAAAETWIRLAARKSKIQARAELDS